MSRHIKSAGKIWSVAEDLLHGILKPSEYGSIVLPLTFLKRLDDLLIPSRNEINLLKKEYAELPPEELSQEVDEKKFIQKRLKIHFINTSECSLRKLTERPPKNVYFDFLTYCQGFPQEVQNILENFSLWPAVRKIQEYNRLHQVIGGFAGFDLSLEQWDHDLMNLLYEELLRRSCETANEKTGDYFTPPDIVALQVGLVLDPGEQSPKADRTVEVFDPCCGTGGTLIACGQYLKSARPGAAVRLHGQELNSFNYAICKSRFLMYNESAENISEPASSFSNDQFPNQKFDYLFACPPFGVPWKIEEKAIREEALKPKSRFSIGLPRTTDGSLLFLLHILDKIRPGGSRIGIIFNSSPMFIGDASFGESEIRRRIIEKDWLEAVIALPNQLFFNTSIYTYLWILSNQKKPRRKGKIQLINGTSCFLPMKKNLGRKNKEVDIEKIQKIFSDFKPNEFSKIYPNRFFGYTRITIERPLLKNGVIQRDRLKRPKADPSKRDYERVPLQQDIDEYFAQEVKPYFPDAWIDRSKNKIGYEINLTQLFHQPQPCRSLTEIQQELRRLNEEIYELSNHELSKSQFQLPE